jgi:hypothetical protein
MDPHLLQLSTDNPALPHYRILRGIEHLLLYLTRIYIGFHFFDLELIYFCGRGHVGILSFLRFKQIRTLVEETILDTMGNEVAIYLRRFDCVVVPVRNSALPDMKYEFASDLVNDRRMDDPTPRGPVSTTSVVMMVT